MLKGKFKTVLDSVLPPEEGIGGEFEGEFARELALACGVSACELTDEEVFTLWAEIEVDNKTRMRRAGRRLGIVSWVSGVAALFALAVLGIDVLRDREEGFSPLFVAGKALEAGADVRLYFDGGRSLSFGGSEVVIEYDGSGIEVGGRAVASGGDVEDGYMQLVVPKGKRSRLVLPDGSTVWVNAGSQVAFPARFKRRSRELFVDGEAYLEVARDEGRPFSVRTTRLDVEVLGTSFDVDAYEGGDEQKVVLVDGSVKVNMAGRRGEQTMLVPGEMFSLGNGISKVSEVDAGRLTAWKDGLLYYSSESLGEIVKDLSHYYGFEIVCSPEASRMRFSGKLDLKESLDAVLGGLMKVADVDYRRRGKSVYAVY